MGFSVDVKDIPLLAEALATAREKGRRQGRADILASALREKFGQDSVPDALLELLWGLDGDATLRMLLRVEGSASIQEVLGDEAVYQIRQG